MLSFIIPSSVHTLITKIFGASLSDYYSQTATYSKIDSLPSWWIRKKSLIFHKAMNGPTQWVFKNITLKAIVHMCACEKACVYECNAQEARERHRSLGDGVTGSQEPLGMLGTQSWSSGREVHAFNCWVISLPSTHQVLKFSLKSWAWWHKHFISGLER